MVSPDFEDTQRIRALTWDALVAGDISKARELVRAQFEPLPTSEPPPAWHAKVAAHFPEA